GRVFRNFDPSALETYSLPVSDTVHGGAKVLDLQVGKAEPILAMFRGTAPTNTEGGIEPATVAVQVLNGSGTQNQAAEASEILRTAGFKMDTPSSSDGVDRTEVRYPPGMEAQAALVARHLFANPVLIPDIDAGQIIVVTGPDFRAALLQPRPAGDF